MSGAIRLTVKSAVMRAEAVRRGAVVWVAEAEFEGPRDLARVIGELSAAEGIPRGARRLEVTLDPSVSQVRTLTGVPPVGPRSLEPLVALQESRYFRRNGKPLVTAARWVDPRRRARRTVVAAAVEEPWLDAIAEGAAKGRFRLAFVRPSSTGPAANLRLRSTSARVRAARSIRRQTLTLFLVSAAAGLGAAATWSLRLHRHVAAVEAEIAALEEPARAASEARRAMEEASSAAAVIARAESERGRMALQFARIASALPQDAFLYVAEWDNRGRGTLTGSAPGNVVLALPGRVEKSGIAGARIEGSPVAEATADGLRERFVIRFGPALP